MCTYTVPRSNDKKKIVMLLTGPIESRIVICQISASTLRLSSEEFERSYVTRRVCYCLPHGIYWRDSLLTKLVLPSGGETRKYSLVDWWHAKSLCVQ